MPSQLPVSAHAPATFLARLRIAGAACLLAGLVVNASASALDALTNVMAFLESRGMTLDAAVAESAGIEAMLKTIDPQARLLSAEQAADLDKVLHGYAQAGAAPTQAVAAVQRPSAEEPEKWVDGLGYLRINGLYRCPGTGLCERVRTAVAFAQTGLILDVRGADGNDLGCVDEIASMFFATNTVLYTLKDGRGGNPTASVSRAVPRVTVPVMLLIDTNTTQAAELLTAALDRAPGVMLVGQRTCGDARIRELIPLPDGRFLYLATRQAYLADDSTYEGKGVTPDIEVHPGETRRPEPAEERAAGKPTTEEARRHRELFARVAADPALARATDLLLGLKALNIHATAGSPDPAR